MTHSYFTITLLLIYVILPGSGQGIFSVARLSFHDADLQPIFSTTSKVVGTRNCLIKTIYN